MSTTMELMGSVTGRPAPIAAAMGSSIKNISLAPADSTVSLTARLSTWVMPDGMETMMRGRTSVRRL